MQYTWATPRDNHSIAMSGINGGGRYAFCVPKQGIGRREGHVPPTM